MKHHQDLESHEYIYPAKYWRVSKQRIFYMFQAEIQDNIKLFRSAKYHSIKGALNFKSSLNLQYLL